MIILITMLSEPVNSSLIELRNIISETNSNKNNNSLLDTLQSAVKKIGDRDVMSHHTGLDKTTMHDQRLDNLLSGFASIFARITQLSTETRLEETTLEAVAQFSKDINQKTEVLLKVVKAIDNNVDLNNASVALTGAAKDLSEAKSLADFFLNFENFRTSLKDWLIRVDKSPKKDELNESVESYAQDLLAQVTEIVKLLKPHLDKLKAKPRRLPNVAVIGTAFGDEGKGRVIGYLSDSDKAKVVIRSQGGANAGHTVYDAAGNKHALHLLPSGILVPGKPNIIASGTVVDPEALITELNDLEKIGEIKPSGEELQLSANAHVITDMHRLIDMVLDKARGKDEIKTTARGIGPTYADKAYRIGIRVGDLLDKDALKKKLGAQVRAQIKLLEGYRSSGALEEGYKALKEPFKNEQGEEKPARMPWLEYPGHTASASMSSTDEELNKFIDDFVEKYSKLGEQLKQYVVPDTSAKVAEIAKEKGGLLFEGAQANALDIDHGVYPFVTSSNTTAAGLLTGSGLGPNSIDHVIGVAKAFMSRSGAGPLPSALKEDEVEAEKALSPGEHGTTTGRKRGICWLDLPLLKYSARINGMDSIALTKMDILGSVPDKVKLCTGYKFDGKPCATIEDLPQGINSFTNENIESGRLKALYSEFDPWDVGAVSKAKTYDELPDEAKEYIEYIEKELGIPVTMIGTGPERDKLIVRQDPFESPRRVPEPEYKLVA